MSASPAIPDRMQIRVVRFESKNPLVGIALLIVVLAILAFMLTAGMALLAGGAAIGGVGYLVRRLFGGRSALGAAPMNGERVLRPEDEVFFPAAGMEQNRGARAVLPRGAVSLKRGEGNTEDTEGSEVAEEDT